MVAAWQSWQSGGARDFSVMLLILQAKGHLMARTDGRRWRGLRVNAAGDELRRTVKVAGVSSVRRRLHKAPYREADLARDLGLSAATVRQACRVLELRGDAVPDDMGRWTLTQHAFIDEDNHARDRTRRQSNS